MGLEFTFAMIGISLAVSGFCIWHQRRERPLGEVSLFPSTIVMILALLLLITSVAHLVSLLTGVPLKGRMGL